MRGDHMQEVSLKNIFLLDFKTNEAYKGLRTNIEFCGDEIHSIVVTSSVPNEGKSSVSFNLAVSMAESGKKVLLLDCDLRKSVLIGRFQIHEELIGMTHYLTGKSSVEQVICTTDIPNLHIIFAGPVPPNPAELLGNNYFKALIKQLPNFYDYIIIDSPPLGSVIDSAIISKNCDGAIIVVSANEVSHKHVQKIKYQLDKSSCKILGAVLNKVDYRENSFYSKYNKRYYGKYNSEYYSDYIGNKEEKTIEEVKVIN